MVAMLRKWTRRPRTASSGLRSPRAKEHAPRPGTHTLPSPPDPIQAQRPRSPGPSLAATLGDVRRFSESLRSAMLRLVSRLNSWGFVLGTLLLLCSTALFWACGDESADGGPAGRLQHEGVAHGESWGNLVGHQVQRKVERRDERTVPHRHRTANRCCRRTRPHRRSWELRGRPRRSGCRNRRRCRHRSCRRYRTGCTPRALD